MAPSKTIIAPVDKIVGPGNLYVTAAKIAVSHEVGIDMPAGPTEIVVTSETGDPPASRPTSSRRPSTTPKRYAILITSRAELAEEVALEVKRLSQQATPSRRSRSRAQGYGFVTESVDEARTLTNRLAPEHLTVDAGSGRPLGAERRLRLHRAPHTAVHGRLHQRPQPRAAHRPQRTVCAAV